MTTAQAGNGVLHLPPSEHYYIEDASPSTADQVPRSLAYPASLRRDAREE